MAIKDGRDYLYLIWKCALNRRQYIVGQLTKNGHYEFQYCEKIEDALKAGFIPLHEATNPHDSNAICVINEGAFRICSKILCGCFCKIYYGRQD